MKTLDALMGKPLFGFALVEAYYLMYDHGLMAFTPAIRTDTNEMAVCLTETNIDQVSALLDPARRPKTKVMRALFLSNGYMGYFLEKGLRGDGRPIRVLNHLDIEHNCAASTEPFTWYPNVA